MANAQECFPHAGGYSATPSFLDMSTGQCLPSAQSSSIVANPQSFPLGMNKNLANPIAGANVPPVLRQALQGLPAQQQQVPMAADMAKQLHAKAMGAAAFQQQQQGFGPRAPAPAAAPMAQPVQAQAQAPPRQAAVQQQQQAAAQHHEMMQAAEQRQLAQNERAYLLHQAQIQQQQQQQIAAYQQQLMQQQQQQQAAALAQAGQFLPETAAAQALRGDMRALYDRQKTRTYHVSLDFSLDQAQTNPGAAAFELSPNAHDIFRLRGDEPGGARAGELSNCIIMGARLVSAQSDARVPLGFEMSNVKGRCYSMNSGQRFAFIIGANCHELHKKRTIHAVTEMIDVSRLDRYGSLTREKIAATIKPVEQQTFSFVEVTSPIMEIIEGNQDRLKIDLSKVSTVNDKFYIVDNQMCQAVCQLFERELFEKMPYTDVRKFTIRARRADGRDYADSTGIAGYDPANPRLLQDALVKVNHIELQFEVDFVIHRPHQQQAIAPLPIEQQVVGYNGVAPAL